MPDAPGAPGGAMPIGWLHRHVLHVELVLDVLERMSVGAIQVDDDGRPILTLLDTRHHEICHKGLVLRFT